MGDLFYNGLLYLVRIQGTGESIRMGSYFKYFYYSARLTSYLDRFVLPEIQDIKDAF